MVKQKMGKVKIFVLLFIAIFLVGSASAFTLNSKGFDKDIGLYGKYQIKNIFQTKLKDVELLENTEQCFGEECYAIKGIYLYKDGSLLDDVRFFKEVQGKWVDTTIKDYSFYIKTKGDIIEVDDYSQVQVGTFINGTTIYKKQKTSSHFVETPKWIEYKLGTDMPEGYYEVKLIGHKQYSWKVDWQVKTSGVWTDEWAVWGSYINNKTEGHGLALTILSGTYTTENEGPEIKIGSKDLTLYNASIAPSDESTICRLLWGNGTVIQEGIARVSNACYFTPYNLTTGNSYRIYLKGSSEPNNRYHAGEGTFTYPIVETDFNWTTCYNPAILEDSVDMWGITDIGYGLINLFGTVTLNTPADNNVSLSANSFNCSAEQIGSDLINISLITNSTGTWTENITNSVTSLVNSTVFSQSFDEGSYLWSCRACDTDGDCGYATENRTIMVDTIAPTITITSPNETFNYSKVGDTLHLNVTSTDANLDICWYDYNETNSTFSCTTGEQENNTFLQEANRFNIKVYANDSVGNEKLSSVSWTYKIFENNLNYSNSTVEGATENFILNVSTGGSLQVSTINLVYNGTSYSSTLAKSGVIVVGSNSLTIPSVSADVNKTFYYSILLSDGSILNSSSNNQTVVNLAIDDCSTHTNLLLNFTLLDEVTKTNITASQNSTIEIDLALLSTSSLTEVLNFSKEYKDKNPALICLGSGLSSTSYYLDILVKYSADNYAVEYYNLQRYVLNSSSMAQNISLYDLNSSSSTEFQVTFKGSNNLPLESALIQIDRQYISEGIFRTVEIPKTDSDGKTVVHLDEKDIIYNIIVSKNGETLKEFNNVVAFCEDSTIGLCKINLQQETGESSFYNYSFEVGIDYSTSYNQATRDFTLLFDTTDGASKNVSVDLYKFDALGGEYIGTSSLDSSSGQVIINVPNSVGNATLQANIYVDEEFKLIDYLKNYNSRNYSTIGYFIFFILMLTLTFMFSTSKSGIIVSSIIGFIAAAYMGIIEGGVLGIGSSIIWLVVAGVILLWKLNSNGGSD